MGLRILAHDVVVVVEAGGGQEAVDPAHPRPRVAADGAQDGPAA